MAGFSSLNTALSALRYQQSALDIASTNIANSSTDGYVRRRVVGETVGAAAAPAVWARSNEIGSGVQQGGVERFADALLDTRVRREHARQSYLDLRATVLGRVEAGIAEPGDSGVAAAISGFRSSLQDLVNTPGSDAARSAVLSSGAILADAFNLQNRNIVDETSDQRARLVATVQEINDVAEQLASTNHVISASTVGGSDLATLQDTRDQLTLRLSQLTGGEGRIAADGTMDVTLNGVTLVTGSSASRISLTGGVNPDGSAGVGTVQLTATAPDGTSAVLPGALSGEAGATIHLIDVDLPAYGTNLHQLMSDLAAQVNTAHRGGFDKTGAAGGDFFTYDPADLSSPLAVAITDTALVAASSIGGAPNLDASNGDKIADAIKIEDGYQQLVNRFGTSVASAERLSLNQQAMTSQVDGAREQLAGVSIDEETVNMVMAQRSYEAAARVMTTVDEILDTLINRTGVVGR
ncbi:flagellar hook-associated protein FlgK [Nocardioides sp. MAH-18]|uniref:Flagellar hook-associated protein 1 n=1 Tax=Nocardioides agri TaxID=2682843 RepID=A0A6L6XV31_9ACTN|nr:MULTISPECIES: flagellar hook-associated protein FlgK [unclassified Nocardioides]MBA2955792.1 flagellar hook-associated protein FlgK [Nocardioides sp. CGMCC 1.13656]MVQ50642.1 flagellar hook-associated protein FlgK [Nocardioides sp. MAH-18]